MVLQPLKMLVDDINVLLTNKLRELKQNKTKQR